MENEGCARVITQGLLFAAAFGIGDFKEFKSRLTTGAYKSIKSLDARPTTNSNRADKILPDNGDGNSGGAAKDATKKPPLVAEKLGSLSGPVTEAMRQMSSIKRRLQDPSRVPGPGLSTDKLDAYADHFAQVFGQTRGRVHPIAKGLPLQRTWGSHITSFSKQ